MTQVLLNEDADTRVSMVETAASARVVAEDEEFDVGVIETADDAAAARMLASILEVAPLLPFVIVTDAEAGAPVLFDHGAQDHLCRADLTQAILLRSCRHAIVRRAAAARSEAAVRRAASGAAATGSTPALPDVLLASTPDAPSDGLLSTVAGLLDSEPIASVTMERLRAETGLDDNQLRRARRPLGNVLLYLVKRDLDAEAELASTCFGSAAGTTTSLHDAVVTTVRTLANFWRQAPSSVRLAADYTGLDERLRDLRYDHLTRLADGAIELLSAHRDEVNQDDPDRALTVAVDQLLAVLDHQRLLGPLHPSEAVPDEVIAEFAAQVGFFLTGPPGAPTAASVSVPAASIEPPVAVPSPPPAVLSRAPAPVFAPAIEIEPEVVAEVQAEPEVAVEVQAEPEVALEAPPGVLDEEERVAVALRRLQAAPARARPTDVAPRPSAPVESATAPVAAVSEAAPAGGVLDEEARVTAALRRLQAASPADTPAARPNRVAPADDPFVTAPGPSQVSPSPAALPPRAESSSLFSRSVAVSTAGAPTFDQRRILVEEHCSDRPPEGEPRSSTPADPQASDTSTMASRSAPSGGRVFSELPTSGAPAGGSTAPTFDMTRIVVEHARASVA